MEHNIVSVSGGKDSTALLLLAIERETENLQAVFADTGHEHPQTYEYVQYLSDKVFPIRTIKADFSAEMERKRDFISTKWREHGVSEERRVCGLHVHQNLRIIPASENLRKSNKVEGQL